jgi:hypothetical protein
VSSVKSSIILICEVSNDADGNGDAQSKNVCNDEDLVLHHAAESYQEVVADHERPVPINMPVR